MMQGTQSKLTIILCVICVLAQVMVAPYISIGTVTPNFVLVTVIVTSFLLGSKVGCIAGFVCGFAYDLVGIGPFGGMALILTLTGYAAGKLARGMLSDSWFFSALFLALTALVAELVYGILLMLTGFSMSFFQAIIFHVLPTALYDAIIGAIILIITNRFSQSQPGSHAKPGTRLR